MSVTIKVHCPRCGYPLEPVSGDYDTGVVAPDGYRETRYESGWYCERCDQVYDEADLPDEGE